MTRNIRKVLGQTAQLANNICGKQNLLHSFPVVVGTTKSSSTNNNYSTKAKKENFINIPKQLNNNNNKLMNILVHDFKNYSSSSVNSNNNIIHVLNPVQYKTWSKEEVCSLLYSPEGNGGAGLTIEDVKLLYDAGFKGTSLGNIVTLIQKKDEFFAVGDTCNSFPTIAPDTLKSVVFWVDNLRKTRLYHLWSKKEEKEQLILAGVNETEVELLFDSGFVMADILANNNLELVEKFEKNKDFSKIVNWINSVRQPIEVTWVDFKLLTLKHHGFEKLDAFSVKFEDFGNGSWLFGKRNEKKKIFSNVEEIKKACDNYILVENSTIRGRPSVEILGQVRTGKTITARYVLPHALADTINKDRMKNNRPKLKMAPTFYIRFDESNNPLETLYKTLEPLRNAIGEQDIPNPTIFDITTTYNDFQTKFPDVHTFIVLDEVQLLQPAHLNVLREFAKNRSFINVTFILTGSTQSRFISVLDKAIKNGLSYDQGTITYIVPTNNTQDMIDDTYQFHTKQFTENQILFIRDTFGCVNCATISQIIEIMEFGRDFATAVDQVVQGIYAIFDRDVLPYFKDRKLDKEMVSFISHGIFSDRLVIDQFYCEYIKYFVDSQNSQNKIYSFRDKLLQTYLQQRLTQTDGYFIISQSYPYQISSHYIIMYDPFKFGERINQCKNNKYPTTAAELGTFWKTNNAIKNLTDSDIDHMYNQVYQLNVNTQSNRKTPSRKKLSANSAKIEKLKEIFILIRHIYSHTAENNASPIKQVHDEMLNSWFNGNRNKFSAFLRELHVLCETPLS